MRVRGLDGREYTWNLSGTSPLLSATRPRSSYHQRARAVLQKLFPLDRRLEEVFLPGSGKLTLDFLLPSRKLAVEVQGEQHFSINSRFHRTNVDFIKSLARDRRKASWCELNLLLLVELPFDEPDDRWEQRIREVTSGTV